MYFYPAQIYLPDFKTVDGKKWAAIACDQFTSEPKYWEEAYRFAADSPSTLNLFLPEAFLDDSERRTRDINENMKKYLDGVLTCRKDAMIYLERTQSDGRVRHGIVGCVDLEDYDYSNGSHSLIRATEGTVIERIPPRVAVRRNATLELPHIMMLIDDPHRTVVEKVALQKDKYELAYDFDLMLGGGHVTGYYIDAEGIEYINTALGKLTDEETLTEKYGSADDVLMFAIGDGNHSLAGAKALYNEIKEKIGADAARVHPSRYALCEVVNLYDDALEFEPIYRVVFGVEPEKFIDEFRRWCAAQNGQHGKSTIECVFGKRSLQVDIANMQSPLPVGNVQRFLDEYLKFHNDAKIDYIHGIDTVKKLAMNENTVGIIFDGMKKEELFCTVMSDGALTRKTFSMGHARDKRYYLECRRIK